MQTVSIINDLLYCFAPSKYHQIWSVGNNKNGQQANTVYDGDDCTKRLTLMDKLPPDLYVNDIITGCWGSTYILCNNKTKLIVFGCNESGQLSISNKRIITDIIINWCKQYYIIASFASIIPIILLYIYKLSLSSVQTPIDIISYNTHSAISSNNLILFMSSGIASHHKFIVTTRLDNNLDSSIRVKDRLFGCGRNDHNQLGLADKYNRSNFTSGEIKFFISNSIELAQIHCARDYTHYLSMKGKLFESSERSIAIRPIKSILTKIIDIRCGYEHTLAINENKWVYSWGENNYGQSGHNKNITYTKVSKPKCIRFLRNNNIETNLISAGQYHSVIVDTYGKIRCFGWNEFYQCGDDTEENIFLSKNSHKINTINETLIKKCIREIKCGFNHTMAVTEDNEYYFWGNNIYNQCMVSDDKIKYVKKPTKWEYTKDIGKCSKICGVYPGWCETRVVTTHKSNLL